MKSEPVDGGLGLSDPFGGGDPLTIGGGDEDDEGGTMFVEFDTRMYSNVEKALLPPASVLVIVALLMLNVAAAPVTGLVAAIWARGGFDTRVELASLKEVGRLRFWSSLIAELRLRSLADSRTISPDKAGDGLQHAPSQ